MYRVRFNLGLGKNHKHWKIYDGKELVRYVDPNQYSLVMYDCTLHNSKLTAKKIYDGMYKTPCAWVSTRHVEVLPKLYEVGDPISYNPRIAPYWQDKNGDDIDGKDFQLLFSSGSKIFQKHLDTIV